MLTFEEARQKVMARMPELGRDIDGGVALMTDRTITKPYGWIFFFNSVRYLETGQILDSLAGNGPIAVLSSSGEVVDLGTALPSKEEIAAFEKERGLRGG